MSKELIKPQNEWNYEIAVESGKRLVGQFQHICLDLVRELYQARKALVNQGYRSDLPVSIYRNNFGPNGPRLGQPHSWEEYLIDIQLPFTTAKRWLKLYIPDEDRLLTVDELKAQVEQRYQDGLKQILAHTGEPDWRPNDWPLAFESRYKAYVLEEERQRRLMQKNYAQIPVNQQLSLFDEPYLMRLGERVQRYNTDIVEYQDFCMKVKPEACPKVPIQKQVNVYKLVKAALEDFEPTVRPDVARFVAELTVRDVAGEFDDCK